MTLTSASTIQVTDTPFPLLSPIPRHSQADVVLFMNLPISARNQEIVSKYSIQVIPFRLGDFNEQFRAYHPSTLRWLMMDDFFEVSELGDVMYSQ